ncbi:unnamed protein product [Discula destructiva]
MADSTNLYFEDWNSAFEDCDSSISAAPGGATDSDSATSIVNSTKMASITSTMEFIWHFPLTFKFQNAILVAEHTGTTLAVGYKSEGQPDPSIDLPQFPVNQGLDTDQTGSLTLDYNTFQNISNVMENHLQADDQVLFFQLGWQEGSVVEYSFSPVWAIAKDDTAATSIYQSMKAKGTDVALSVSQAAKSAPMTMPLVPVTALSATSTSTPSTSSAEGASTTASAGASSSQAEASHAKMYGPLSTGALIGVIVGGVAALVLILTLAILCVRRRRRNSRKHGDHARDTQDLMAEKEARAAGTAPDTPHSEESSQRLNRGLGLSGLDDDGVMGAPRGGGGGEASRRGSAVYSSLRNVTTVGTGAGGTSALGVSPTNTHPTSSSSSSVSSSSSISLHDPYADRVHNPAGNPVSPVHDAEAEHSPLTPPGVLDDEARTATPALGPPRLARSDTPGGMSFSDYLHEDGMTEEEIRRLEEEERALDEAIERAGRTNGRAGWGR